MEYKQKSRPFEEQLFCFWSDFGAASVKGLIWI
jgi:hypothetical protein